MTPQRAAISSMRGFTTPDETSNAGLSPLPVPGFLGTAKPKVEEGPGIYDSIIAPGLDVFGKVAGAGKRVVDTAANYYADLPNALNPNVDPIPTGELMKEALFPREDAAPASIAGIPLPSGNAKNSYAKSIAREVTGFGTDLATDPLTYALGPVGEAGAAGKTAEAALKAGIVPEAAAAAARAAQVGKVARPIDAILGTLFTGQMGMGSYHAAKGAYESYLKHGFSPEVAAEMVGAALGGTFAGLGLKHTAGRLRGERPYVSTPEENARGEEIARDVRPAEHLPDDELMDAADWRQAQLDAEARDRAVQAMPETVGDMLKGPMPGGAAPAPPAEAPVAAQEGASAPVRPFAQERTAAEPVDVLAALDDPLYNDAVRRRASETQDAIDALGDGATARQASAEALARGQEAAKVAEERAAFDSAAQQQRAREGAAAAEKARLEKLAVDAVMKARGPEIVVPETYGGARPRTIAPDDFARGEDRSAPSGPPVVPEISAVQPVREPGPGDAPAPSGLSVAADDRVALPEVPRDAPRAAADRAEVPGGEIPSRPAAGGRPGDLDHVRSVVAARRPNVSPIQAIIADGQARGEKVSPSKAQRLLKESQRAAPKETGPHADAIDATLQQMEKRLRTAEAPTRVPVRGKNGIETKVPVAGARAELGLENLDFGTTNGGKPREVSNDQLAAAIKRDADNPVYLQAKAAAERADPFGYVAAAEEQPAAAEPTEFGGRRGSERRGPEVPVENERRSDTAEDRRFVQRREAIAQEEGLPVSHSAVKKLVDSELDRRTGVWNANAYEAAIERGEKPAAVTEVDVAGAGATNKKFGEPYTDAILKATARALKGVAGDHGVVYRKGGDEFVIHWNDYETGQRLHANVADALRQAEIVVERDGHVVAEWAGVDHYDGFGREFEEASSAVYAKKPTEGQPGFKQLPPGLAERVERGTKVQRSGATPVGERVPGAEGGETGAGGDEDVGLPPTGSEPKYAVRRPPPGQRGLPDIANDVEPAHEKKRAPEQTDMFGAKDMLVPTEARVTEGREADGPLFTQERDQAARDEAKKQKPLFRRAQQAEGAPTAELVRKRFSGIGKVTEEDGAVRVSFGDGRGDIVIRGADKIEATGADASALKQAHPDSAGAQILGVTRSIGRDALIDVLEGKTGLDTLGHEELHAILKTGRLRPDEIDAIFRQHGFKPGDGEDAFARAEERVADAVGKRIAAVVKDPARLTAQPPWFQRMWSNLKRLYNAFQDGRRGATAEGVAGKIASGDVYRKEGVLERGARAAGEIVGEKRAEAVAVGEEPKFATAREFEKAAKGRSGLEPKIAEELIPADKENRFTEETVPRGGFAPSKVKPIPPGSKPGSPPPVVVSKVRPIPPGVRPGDRIRVQTPEGPKEATVVNRGDEASTGPQMKGRVAVRVDGGKKMFVRPEEILAEATAREPAPQLTPSESVKNVVAGAQHKLKADDVVPFNLDRMNVSPENKRLLAKEYAANPELWDKAAGGVHTFDQFKREAGTLSATVTPQEFAEAIKNGAPLASPGAVVYAKNIADVLRRKAFDAHGELMAAVAKGRGTAEAEADYLAASLERANFELAFKGRQAEAARTLAAFRILSENRGMPLEKLIRKIFSESCVWLLASLGALHAIQGLI